MRAYFNYFNRYQTKAPSEVVFSAKRRWTEEYGYGVLLKDIPEEVLS